jgi:ribonuclease D
MRKYREEIPKEELKDFPVRKFEGDVLVVDTLNTAVKAVEELKKSDIVGFDTETKPSFKKGRKNKVALLQLATLDKAFLFRLTDIGIPAILLDFLADPDVKKTGVAISDDLKGLKEWGDFKPGGFIELQEMVKDYGIVSMGLKKLTAIILGFTISKRQQVTNWENDKLSDAQVIYAATDAWVCNLIYRQLLNGEQ